MLETLYMYALDSLGLELLLGLWLVDLGLRVESG